MMKGATPHQKLMLAIAANSHDAAFEILKMHIVGLQESDARQMAMEFTQLLANKLRADKRFKELSHEQFGQPA